MISVFQTILGEEKYREKLLSHFIKESSTNYWKFNYFGLGDYATTHDNCYSLNDVESVLEKAKKTQTTAFITYIYKQTTSNLSFMPNFNKADEIFVHYVMLVFNPNSNTVYYIDPKGRHLERSQ
jgi:hypothetical protein